MKRTNKKYAQRIHAKSRAKERYGIDFTAQKRNEIIKMIKHDHVVSRKKQTNRTSIITIRYGDQLIKLVYDKSRKEIVTFLPVKQ